MCIIVYKPVGQKLNRETLARCYIKNDDGAGFAGVSEGKIILHKSLKKFKKIYGAYKRLIIDPGLEEKIPVLWHFRIKTHGAISIENTHPFILEGDNVVFAHNGVIAGNDISESDTKSDTLKLKINILDKLQKINKNWINNETIWELLTNYIGKYSKCVFLDNKGNVKIYNEKDGEWDKGIWYSNSSYESCTPAFKHQYFSYTYSGYNTHNNHTINCNCWACKQEDDDKSYENYHKPIMNIYGGYKLYCKYCKQRMLTKSEREGGICVNCASTIIYNRFIYIN